MSSPDEFWKETPQSLLRSKGDQGCSPCQKAARENMKHMQMQQMKGRAMDMYHSKVFAFGAGIALGALIMHMYMKRQ